MIASRSKRVLALLALGALAPLTTWAQAPSILKYKGRFDTGPGIDKIQDVVVLDQEYVAAVSPRGLTILDRQAIDSGTTEDYVVRYEIDSRGEPSNLDGAPPGDSHYGPKFFHVVSYPPYLYVSTRFDGLWIFRVERSRGAVVGLTEVGRLLRPREFTEGIAVLGDRLYLSHHLDGVEVLDLLPDPEQPQTLALYKGWNRVDAWGIAAREDGTVWVAGGLAGTRRLLLQGDVLTEAGGDTFGSSPGSVMDVAAAGDWVVAAVAAQGLAVYDPSTAERVGSFSLPGVCVDVKAVSETRLVVACRTWVHAVEVRPAGQIELLASARLHRRVSDQPGNRNFTYHLAAGIAADGDSVYVAGWHHLDALELVADDPDDDADLEISGQRAQFSPSGGTLTLEVTNSGEGLLAIDPLHCTPTSFECSLDSRFLDSGQSTSLRVTWDGTPTVPQYNLDLVSNDPADSPTRVIVLPTREDRVDPDEPAPDFTGTLMRRDYARDRFIERPLTLSQRTGRGRPVHFAIFGSWCPACIPAVGSMVGDVHARFPRGADFFLVNPEGIPELVRHLMEKIYLPMNVFMDNDGTVNDLYWQPKVGLPFGRGYVVDQNGVVSLLSVSYDPARVLDAVDALLP